MIKMKIFVLNRFFALKYAADAASTVLRVDQVRKFISGNGFFCCYCTFFFNVVNILVMQIIMAKPAGGPRRGDRPAGMDED
jgi:hypothetical protein